MLSECQALCQALPPLNCKSQGALGVLVSQMLEVDLDMTQEDQGGHGGMQGKGGVSVVSKDQQTTLGDG